MSGLMPIIDPADAAKIITEWPTTQRKVAEQMLTRCDSHSEATPTRRPRACPVDFLTVGVYTISGEWPSESS